MKNIKTYLDSAAEAYYAGHPFISDEVFDRLADCVGYKKVGAKQHENLKRHYYRMYSLQKYYENEAAVPLPVGKDITNSPKLDGASVSSLHIDGMLVQVLQRGDGIEGIDVTNKFLAVKHLIPHEIPYKGVLQVTLEIVAPKTIKNARNYAAGALNLNNVEEFKSRNLNCFAHGVFPALTDTFYEDMRKLSNMGFGTVYDEGIMDIYPCDGMVFRLNKNDEFYDMGYTSLHPRGAYAKKERKPGVETKILSVEWQVGKSGKVTPVAILEPVDIDGAIVSRATLNNPGFIESLNIEIGDTVSVIRAGDIIPCITHKVEG